MQIVSVGEDGKICLADSASTTAAEQFRAARATASYAAVKWASLKTFVTAGTTGENRRQSHSVCLSLVWLPGLLKGNLEVVSVLERY